MRREGGTDGGERERGCRERRGPVRSVISAQCSGCQVMRLMPTMGPMHNVISALCSEYQCDETQPSTGNGLVLRVGHMGPYSDV